MTHISRFKLGQNTHKEITFALKEVLLNLKSKDYEKVFYALITKTEEEMISKRLAIIIMLSEGQSYEIISRSLHVTNQTISGIHINMKYSPEEYKFIINKLKPYKRKLLLKEILKSLALSSAKLVAKHAGGRIR